MNKTVVIHQPDFIPYIGFFQRFLNADLFVIQDGVQFSKRGWTHRDKIKTPAGEEWLTLNLQKHPHTTSINHIYLSSNDWRKDHLKKIKENYQKSPFFDEIFPLILSLYDEPTILMAEFNLKAIELLMDLFDVRLPYVLASELSARGKSNKLLIEQLQEVGASQYLSGNGARDYMESDKFIEAGIEVVWQQFAHPVYPQQFGAFVPYLSAVDLLFNCGISASRKILREET
jgi:hypothetical protein